MAEARPITQENFKLLLGWLDADEGLAALRYEAIRARLTRFFVGRGCYEADLLADRTIDRVTLKLPDLNGNYVGDPIAYFYGVARNIYHEWLRQQKREREVKIPDAAATDNEARELEYRCLESCLSKLAANVREMVVEYYQGEKRAKIERRRHLAEQLGMTSGALQTKMNRLRARLLECVTDCMCGLE